eukprot:TRINITY_DN65565_c0_g1_i1.p2 TRINITY_DN65565_c0_g1~~TRINITY_DN65565_c0_g1_i1.p2  ORF type:complete len:458 (+),score=160.41 TRINITY_DN65565_c0_g1_i1:96-1376(+)
MFRPVVSAARGAFPRGQLRLQQRLASKFADVKMGPPDPILGLSVAFQQDTFPNKVNLGVGAYRDDAGKPYVLSCVREAEKRVSGHQNHEYAGITGLPQYVPLAQKLLLGEDSPALKDGRVASAQTISGTGALRVAGAFLSRFYPFPAGKEIYVPKPTWGNHVPIFRDSGIEVKEYTYYNPDTCGLNLSAMLADLEKIPDGSVVLLHACAHNPTGVDPTDTEWVQISELIKRKGHYTFFDSAYQGFASGDPEADAFALRHFIKEGHNMVITQSFAKNFGLYGQRVGAVHFVCESPDEKARVDSQVKILIRPMYSNPPIHGAHLVSTILGDSALTKQWRDEVKLMANRIIDMRKALTQELKALGSTRDWAHIEKQIGMFCFTGLSAEQCKRMVEEFHVYMTSNGRISMAGVTSGNVKYVANAIHECTK